MSDSARLSTNIGDKREKGEGRNDGETMVIAITDKEMVATTDDD